MLKTKNIKINPNKLATNISVTFEDPEVHFDQYTFLKDRLNTYHLYLNEEYDFKTEIEYDKSSQIILIGINVTIPEQFISKDTNKAHETFMDTVNIFQQFYEAQNLIYKKKFYI
jgi:hypothetical protein